MRSRHIKILAVDFDKTLFHTDYPSIKGQKFVNKCVTRYIRRKKKQGWVIILNTMREPGKGLEEAIQACKDYDIPIDYVNDNPPEMTEQFGYSRKIGATRYIDDHNIGLLGWILRRFG